MPKLIPLNKSQKYRANHDKYLYTEKVFKILNFLFIEKSLERKQDLKISYMSLFI